MEFSVKKAVCCSDEPLESAAQYAKLRFPVESTRTLKIRSAGVSWGTGAGST